MNVLHIIIGISLIKVINCYMLVQVRKDDNQSNTDVLINKLVPSDEFQNIAKTARKQFTHFKQYKIKNKPEDKELQSIVFAIKTNTGANSEKQYGRHSDNTVDILTALKDMVLDFITPEADHPAFRSTKYNIKPKLIRLRSGDHKPSVMYEVQTTSLLQSINDALKSRQVRRYSDNIARTAAYVMRIIKSS